MGLAGVVLRKNRAMAWKTYGAVAASLFFISNAMSLGAIVEERSHK